MLEDPFVMCVAKPSITNVGSIVPSAVECLRKRR